MTDLRQMLADRKARDGVLLAWYRANTKAVRQAMLGEVRCQKGCLLFRAWRMRDVIAFYQPGYKLSHALNQRETVAAARAKRTSDGDRRWTEAAHVLDDLRGWGPRAGLGLQCDHFRGTASADKLLALVDQAAPGRPSRTVVAPGCPLLLVPS